MGLLHNDTFPRNMMVVRQQPRDRVVWIDFDCAQIVQRGKCEEWTEKSFFEEGELMAEFAEFLVGVALWSTVTAMHFANRHSYLGRRR